MVNCKEKRNSYLNVLVLIYVIVANVAADQACTPYQVHTSLTGIQGEMRIVWSTVSDDCSSEIRYWKQGANSDNALQATGVKDFYQAEDMCTSPAVDNEFPAFFIHHAIATKLDEDSVYEYSLGDQDGSVDRWFKTAPEIGFDTPVTILAVGDTGQPVVKAHKNPGAKNTFRQMSKEVDKVDLVLHAGDLSYADGDPEGWTAFMDLIEPIASHVPYMVCIGNHEFDYVGYSENDPSEQEHYQPHWGNYGDDSGGECGIPVVKRFPALSSTRHDQSSLPFWYSFDYGSVHIITLSTEHSLGHHHPQYEWLKHDLRNVVRCRTPWIIIQMHRPMYIPVDNRNAIVSNHIRHHIQDLLIDFKVDLVVSGHFHAYYRTCLVHEYDCVKNKGVTQLVVGNGGRHFDEFDDELPEWVVNGSDEDYGYARISVRDGLRMKVEIVKSEDGGLLDEFELDKDPHDRNLKCDSDFIAEE